MASGIIDSNGIQFKLDYQDIAKLCHKFQISENDLSKYHLKPLEKWFLKEKKRIDRHYLNEDNQFSQEQLNFVYHDLLDKYLRLLGLAE